MEGKCQRYRERKNAHTGNQAGTKAVTISDIFVCLFLLLLLCFVLF